MCVHTWLYIYIYMHTYIYIHTYDVATLEIIKKDKRVRYHLYKNTHIQYITYEIVEGSFQVKIAGLRKLSAVVQHKEYRYCTYLQMSNACNHKI